MISTSTITSPEFIELGLKSKLEDVYSRSGIPKKYHFKTLGTAWSTEFSTSQKLTGIAKKRSQNVAKFIEVYASGIDSILNGNGLRLKLKDSFKIVTDFILDGKKASGKTLLTSIIAQESINRGYKVKFVNWTEFLDRFQSFENREENENYYFDCLEADLLIFDSVYDYNTSNKFFNLQLDRLISTRQNAAKTIICCVDTNAGVPIYGNIWNRFTRETYTLQLPEPTLSNENKPKRTRTQDA